MQTGSRTWPLHLGVALAVLGIDQGTKALVVENLAGQPPVELLGGAVTLRYVENTGAAFSLLPSATVVFTVIAVAIVVVILRMGTRLRSAVWAAGLGLVLGGALGNLTDRFLRDPGGGRGPVVDWIDVGRWPVFNVADVAVVSGAVLCAWLVLRGVSLDGTPDGTRDDD